MQNRLSHVALVTGADSGIGQVIAHVLAAEGADIIVVFHTDTQGAERTRALVEACGRRCLLRQLDVRDQRAVAELFDQPTAAFGVPEILVNCAGVGERSMPVMETPEQEWDRVIRTDLYGPFFCCRHFVQARKSVGGGGRIINLTSVHDSIPSPNNAAYGAAKGGLKTFTRSLALEVARDRITVNAIAPGMIRTPMTAERAEDPEKLRQAEAHIPLGRIGEPHEVASLAVWLAGPNASYVTGQSFVIASPLSSTAGWR